MKTIFIITIIVVVELGQVSCLSIDDPDCIKYLDKIQYPNISKLAFTGDVSFVTKTTNAKVTLRYTDYDLFNDPIYFGFVKEDGKQDDQVCLDLKLWKYASKCYEDPVQVTDLTITPSDNSEKQWRYYSFIIPENEFKTRLIKKSNSDQFIYTGYYSIGYYAVGTDTLQYEFLFQFSLSIDKATGASIDTSFKPFYYDYLIDYKVASEVNWCADLACTEYATPDLHLNDKFVLQQVISTHGACNFYLTETQVWYIGDGLFMQYYQFQQFDSHMYITSNNIYLFNNFFLIYISFSLLQKNMILLKGYNSTAFTFSHYGKLRKFGCFEEVQADISISLQQKSQAKEFHFF